MLEAYKSYDDPHLTEYWTDDKKWKRLVKNGVITRNGTPIDDITFRANEIKDWKERVSNDVTLHRMRVRQRQIEKDNDTVIQQKINEIEKINNVLRVKSGLSPRSRANSRHVGPFSHSSSPSRSRTRLSGKPRSAVGWSRASSAHQEPSEVIIVREKESSFAGSDTRSTTGPGSATPSLVRSRTGSSLKTPPGYHVVAFDGKDSREGVKQGKAGRGFPLIDQKDDLSITELERSVGLKLGDNKHKHYPWVYLDSPYLESQMPYEWRAFSSALRSASANNRRHRSGSSHGKRRSFTSMGVTRGKQQQQQKRQQQKQKQKQQQHQQQQQQQGNGALTEHYRRVSVPAENLENESDNWEQMEVKMVYHGDLFHNQRDDKAPFDEIVVEQQHCGGNTVNVFRGNVLPGEEFSFVSHRHPGFPFSLNLYVNGKKDSRVSTCCEYKHTRGVRLGSKSGQFSITDIIGGGPCRRCMEKIAQRKIKKQISVDYNPNKQPKQKDQNDHDYYPLKISVEGDEIYGASIRNDDDYTDDDDDDESDDDVRSVHSPNTHDYYDLKVSLEDDDYDYRSPRSKN